MRDVRGLLCLISLFVSNFFPLAMIADRVVLLPGVVVGRRAVLGSGTLTTRGAKYEDGSTWMGSGKSALSSHLK